MKHKIVLHQSEEGYSLWVPGLPGCCSQGETEAEAISNIEIAAREYLSAVEDLLDGGEVREIEVAVQGRRTSRGQPPACGAGPGEGRLPHTSPRQAHRDVGWRSRADDPEKQSRQCDHDGGNRQGRRIER